MSGKVALEAVEALASGWMEPLTFAVREGEFLAITGPALSGKTALLRALVGETKLLSGRIHRASPIASTDRDMKATSTAKTLLKRMKPSPTEDRITEALQATGLYPFSGTRSSALSDSLRPSLPVAPLLASSAKILVVDGLFDHLSPYVLSSTLALLRRRRQQGSAVVTVTARTEVLAESDLILGLTAGRQRLLTSPRQLLADDAERRVTVTPIGSRPSDAIRPRAALSVLYQDGVQLATQVRSDVLEAVIQGCGQVEVSLQGHRDLGAILIDLLS